MRDRRRSTPWRGDRQGGQGSLLAGRLLQSQGLRNVSDRLKNGLRMSESVLRTGLEIEKATQAF